MAKKYREATKDDIGTMVEVSDSGESKWRTRELEHIYSRPTEEGYRYLCWSSIHGVAVGYRHARVAMPPSYTDLHVASGLKVGDWVRITRKAESKEQGWAAVWAPGMDKYVGCVAQIKSNKWEYGFKIIGTDDWNFPCFVLEKATSRPATEADVGELVAWQPSGSSLGAYILESVFTLHRQGQAPPRAVLQPADGCGELKFAFLSDLSVSLVSVETQEAQANAN